MDERIIGLATRTVEPAPSGDGTAIALHVGKAPFDLTRHTAAEGAAIGTPIAGCPHPTTGEQIVDETVLTSLEAHTVKRIKEGRWIAGTLPSDYLNDLRGAGTAPTRVKVGENYGAPLASVVAAVGALPAGAKIVAQPGHSVFVVYNARKRAIVSGYSEPEQKIFELHRAWKKMRIIPL